MCSVEDTGKENQPPDSLGALSEDDDDDEIQYSDGSSINTKLTFIVTVFI